MSENYSDKVKCIIKQGQIAKSKLGIMGPTGPRGQIGPTGPTGPTSETVFGRKYDNTANTIALQANTAMNIPLGNNGPYSGVTVETQDTLTIVEEGNYKIDYFFSGSTNTAGNITVEVKQNNASIGSTTIVKSLTPNNNTDFSGSSINALAAGDKINLIIKSSAAATITKSAGTNAFLNIFKL